MILLFRKTHEKYMPGFVPIGFHQAGKILLLAGILFLLLKMLSFGTGWFLIPSAVLFAGGFSLF